MIANCPACGTHYKHDRPPVPTRARCVRCDTAFELGRLRPYRIDPVSVPRPEDAARAARHLPIGLDDPALATTIARNVRQERAERFRAAPLVEAAPPEARKGAPPSIDTWEDGDPLPPIPEMREPGGHAPAIEATSAVPALALDTPLARRVPRGIDAAETAAPEGGRGMAFALWLVAGAIVGTGASWTLGGTTPTGMGAGVVAGALLGWGWLRWTSSR